MTRLVHARACCTALSDGGQTRRSFVGRFGKVKPRGVEGQDWWGLATWDPRGTQGSGVVEVQRSMKPQRRNSNMRKPKKQ